MWWFQDLVYDFLTILVVMNPLIVLPIFIGLTAGHDPATRRRIAGAMTLVAFIVLLALICIGQITIDALGISLNAFSISGGLILFIFAAQLVIGEQRSAPESDADAADPMRLAVYPLAIPGLAGPGTMLTAILRTDNTRFSLLEQAHTAAALALVLAVTYALLRLAGPVIRVIGEGGANVIQRMMGMILAAYAVTLVLHGIAGWLGLPPP